MNDPKLDKDEGPVGALGRAESADARPSPAESDPTASQTTPSAPPHPDDAPVSGVEKTQYAGDVLPHPEGPRASTSAHDASQLPPEDGPVSGVEKTQYANDYPSSPRPHTQHTLAEPAARMAVQQGQHGQLLAGRYEILRLLGSGGMGSVYCVRDNELNEIVALKMLRRELDGAAGMLERFRQEVKLARRVTHPNVARTFDIGEHGGQKFLTMEFIEGEPLSAILRRDKGLPPRQVIELLVQICAGLAAAHAAGIIHRDLKPDNVMVTHDGRAVITDFGIAHANIDGQATETHFAVGTPAYMAPEQVEARPDIDERADLYALGALAYEMLTGARAWPGDAAFAVANARLTSPPPDPRQLRPAVPEDLARLVVRLMATQREDRFARADEVAARLTTLLDALVHAAPADGASPATITPVPVLVDRSLTSLGRTEKAVAVLPFRNTGAAEDEYIADGLTEDLIDTLSVTRGLRVRPRGVVMRLKGREEDPRELGRELGVQVVVDGSLRKSQDAYRMAVRVVSVADGFQIWAQRIDCPAGDLLHASDELARKIAEALTTDVAAPARVVHADPVAIELYMRARSELRKGWHSNASLAKAADQSFQALSRLPNDPMIAATCAIAYARLAFGGGAGLAETLARAQQAADRAVSLAPHLGESWVAMASVRQIEMDLPSAAKALKQAVTVAPRVAKAREMYGRMLVEAGRLEEGIEHLEAALRLDPSVIEPRWDLVRARALRGEWDQVDALLDLPVEDDGASTMREWFRARLGLWSVRIRPYQGDLDLEYAPGDGIPRTITLIYREVISTGTIGEEHRNYFVAQSSVVGKRLRCVIWQYQAEMLAGMKTIDVDGVLEAVKMSIDSGLADIAWIDQCPLFEPVRSDPRWAPLRARVASRAGRVIDAIKSE